MRLAELKMYVHKEHVHDEAVKKHLKHKYVDAEKASDGEQAATGIASREISKLNDPDPTTVTPVNDSSESGHTSPQCGIHGVIHNLIQAVNDDEQDSEYLATRTSPPASQYSCISIKDLLDYSNAESWLGSFYTIAIRCLDDDLELYQLLDLDAEGIDDPDSHAEDVLAE
ncbi:hypothetical protein OG21DRAFT_1489428 [Imleria badia]|nr:hypothetical protein OG21DRAFT_1489428 [Imleria badia]